MNRIHTFVTRSIHRFLCGAVVVAALATGCDEAAPDDASPRETPADLVALDLSEEVVDAAMSIDLDLKADDAEVAAGKCGKTPNGCTICCPTLYQCHITCPGG